ncbi:MAG: hypothetical protein AAF542_23235 [Pseudomonadota bacterium]
MSKDVAARKNMANAVLNGQEKKLVKHVASKLVAPALLLALFTSGSTIANHVDDKYERPLDDGGKYTSKSFKTNFLVYKSIGGSTSVKGKEKKRKWYCVWLCKVRKDKKVQRIVIQNTYYSELSPGNFTLYQEQPKVCENSSSCTQKEWAAGASIKIPFPGGGTIDNLLPIDGVVTRHEIHIEGQQMKSELTSKGKHPDPGIPPIQ